MSWHGYLRDGLYQCDCLEGMPAFVLNSAKHQPHWSSCTKCSILAFFSSLLSFLASFSLPTPSLFCCFPARIPGTGNPCHGRGSLNPGRRNSRPDAGIFDLGSSNPCPGMGSSKADCINSIVLNILNWFQQTQTGLKLMCMLCPNTYNMRSRLSMPMFIICFCYNVVLFCCFSVSLRWSLTRDPWEWLAAAKFAVGPLQTLIIPPFLSLYSILNIKFSFRESGFASRLLPILSHIPSIIASYLWLCLIAEGT